jgi:hypothetical protein
MVANSPDATSGAACARKWRKGGLVFWRREDRCTIVQVASWVNHGIREHFRILRFAGRQYAIVINANESVQLCGMSFGTGRWLDQHVRSTVDGTAESLGIHSHGEARWRIRGMRLRQWPSPPQPLGSPALEHERVLMTVAPKPTVRWEGSRVSSVVVQYDDVLITDPHTAQL